jgi:hypothetical protein
MDDGFKKEMVRDHNYVYSASECSKGENFTCSESDRK